MKLFWSIIILAMCFITLVGCSNEKIMNEPIYQKATEIQSMVNQSQWEKAKNEVKVIQNLFKQNKWKYQLLGDETEYGGLNQEISKLQIAIEEQDKKEAKLHITMIQNYLQSLYFN